MKIAIDALGISRIGGGRSATLNLLEPLLTLDQDNEYLLFLDEYEPQLERENLRQIIAPTTNRFRVRLWAQATWPRLLKKERTNLIHHTKNLMIHSAPCPSIVTIHDFTIFEHPEIFPKIDVLYWRTFEKVAVRQASHVIAISQLTADDLQRFYGIPLTKISIIPEGIEDSFKPASTLEVSDIRKRYGLPEHYILHVGSISAKKNLATLAEAYFSLVKKGEYQGALVLVGRRYWQQGDPKLDQILRENVGIGNVILTGPAPQEDLAPLYTGADCLCFVSIHEGFGLPPMEAATCGIPVISTRVGAVEQLMNDVPRYIDNPLNSSEIAQQISAIVTDPKEAIFRSQKGLEIAPTFSRKYAAQKTLELYGKAMKI